MKFGLVLEGGAMRGLFTAGVIDVLMENEITFDAVAGVSAGAASVVCSVCCVSGAVSGSIFKGFLTNGESSEFGSKVEYKGRTAYGAIICGFAAEALAGC